MIIGKMSNKKLKSYEIQTHLPHRARSRARVDIHQQVIGLLEKDGPYRDWSIQ